MHFPNLPPKSLKPPDPDTVPMKHPSRVGRTMSLLQRHQNVLEGFLKLLDEQYPKAKKRSVPIPFESLNKDGALQKLIKIWVPFDPMDLGLIFNRYTYLFPECLPTEADPGNQQRAICDYLFAEVKAWYALNQRAIQQVYADKKSSQKLVLLKDLIRIRPY